MSRRVGKFENSSAASQACRKRRLIGHVGKAKGSQPTNIKNSLVIWQHNKKWPSVPCIPLMGRGCEESHGFGQALQLGNVWILVVGVWTPHKSRRSIGA